MNSKYFTLGWLSSSFSQNMRWILSFPNHFHFWRLISPRHQGPPDTRQLVSNGKVKEMEESWKETNWAFRQGEQPLFKGLTHLLGNNWTPWNITEITRCASSASIKFTARVMYRYWVAASPTSLRIIRGEAINLILSIFLVFLIPKMLRWDLDSLLLEG